MRSYDIVASLLHRDDIDLNEHPPKRKRGSRYQRSGGFVVAPTLFNVFNHDATFFIMVNYQKPGRQVLELQANGGSSG